MTILSRDCVMICKLVSSRLHDPSMSTQSISDYLTKQIFIDRNIVCLYFELLAITNHVSIGNISLIESTSCYTRQCCKKASLNGPQRLSSIVLTFYV